MDRIHPAVEGTPSAQGLIDLFNGLFEQSCHTTLEGGGSEPVYIPGEAGVANSRVIFTRDYFSSALHEVAHWCIAGAERRALPDYGYWYAPDGRNAEQQVAFQSVEVKPQALECIFSQACGISFAPSLDNLEGEVEGAETFARAIAAQVAQYKDKGLPARAESFQCALEAWSGIQVARVITSVEWECEHARA